jgi:2-polyprenyl-3-methyl-5-hydroxy-6-metoxy-1,4-benzoquinol methylase
MNYFASRSTQPEWMDEQSTSFEEFHHCLQTLEKINVCTLAYPPTLKWIRKMLVHLKAEPHIKVWDIGSGGGDMLRRIRKLAKSSRTEVELTGIDIHPFAQRSAQLSTPAQMNIDYEISDIYAVAQERQADLIISSLFTHHLGDEELIRFIRWMEQHASKGWFINDLHRHPIPYCVIKYSVKFLRLNRLVVHDAPVSVARAFTRKEWQALLTRAGVPLDAVTIRWSFPFRYCVARIKP